MKELSLHILDVAKNSVAAGAGRIAITLTEDESGWLTITIADDGRGMSPEFLAAVTDPFTTTRTTRRVGMGLALYRMAAEQTGGGLDIQSTEGAGTTVTARFDRRHLDCAPMGDLPSAIATLIQGSPDAALDFRHTTPRGAAALTTGEMKAVLGDEVPLSDPEVILWVIDDLSEQEAQLEGAVQ